MKHTKKLLSIFLSLCMLLSITGGLDFSSYASVSSDYRYTLSSDGTITILSYRGNDKDITIPSKIDNHRVICIAGLAFYNLTSITSVTIPDSITSIGSSAFSGCKKLSSISISNSVQTIGNNAFENCTSLVNVRIPNSTKSMGDYVFKNCTKLKSITIGSNVTKIGREAFRYCENLENIEIPNGVKSIEYGTFYNCERLASISFPSSLLNIDKYAFEGCEGLTSIDTNNVETISSEAFYSCYNLSTITIGKGLKSLGDDVFDKCDLKSFSVNASNKYFTSYQGVLYNKDKSEIIKYPNASEKTSFVIPATVKTIGKSAFKWAVYLTSISIPNSVATIEDDAFNYCQSLTDIDIPNSVVTIGDNAFHLCSALADVQFNNGVKSIGRYSFSSCHKLTEVELPDSLTNIGDFAFNNCFKLSDVTISKNVFSIGYGIFSGAENLQSVSIDADNPCFTVKDGVLYDKKMTTLVFYPSGKTDEKFTVPDTVVTIGGGAFQASVYLKELVISDKTREIGKNAISFCIGLNKVVIGSNVSFIDVHAFEYDKALKNVYFKGNAPQIKASGYWEAFSDDETNAYYPAGDTTWTADIMKKLGSDLTWSTWDTPVVKKTDISKCSITLSSNSYVYDGNQKKPAMTIKDGSVVLKNGLDYNISYSNNVNAGIATINIEGIGNYKGNCTKNFSINKASQYVSCSVSVPNLKAGETTTINAKGIGTISYKSNNTSVATVSSLGVITAKSQGTATITVTASGDNNHNSASNTVTVNVSKVQSTSKTLTIDTLTYSFSNSRSGFNYPSNYVIPKERYKMFFSDREIEDIYNWFGAWGGNCFGMATTSAMFNTESSTLKINSFNSSAKKVKDLKYNDKSASLNLTITELNEAMLISQATPECEKAKKDNRDDLNALCDEVKKSEKGNPPVLIGFGNSAIGGHAVLAYKIEKINSTTSYLHVYDCNYPNQDKYMVLTTDSKGSYTKWKYNLGNYAVGTDYAYTTNGINAYKSYIYYINYEVFEAVWEGRNTNKDRNINKMSINSDNFEICNLNGKVVASMSDGVFTSKSDEIYECDFCDISVENHIIYLPTDAYRIVNTEINNTDDLTISVVNVEQSIDITTTADSVDVLVDDKQGANVATVNAEHGETYEITTSSDIDFQLDGEEVTYIGKCYDETTVGSSYNEKVAENYSNSIVFIDDSTLNLGHESDITLNDEDTTITLASDSFTYDGKNKEPVVLSVMYKSIPLKQGIDYTVVYSNNINSGTAYATVYGINDYKGKATKTFIINPINVSNYNVDLSSTSYTYDGLAKKPSVTVKDKQGNIISSSNYVVKYANNINAGTATVTVDFKNNLIGAISKKYTIKKKDLSNANIALSSNSYTYNGKAQKPSVTVKDSKGKKLASSNYSVSYSSGRKNVGKYTVTIKFKGNYSGAVNKTFTIVPKSTAISKVTAGKKAFTVKWKKQATQTTGYQIQYATDSKFTKNKKTVTVSKNKTTSKKLSKLKAKKKYYVRVRTYKTVNGTKYYSSWSKAKTVKTK